MKSVRQWRGWRRLERLALWAVFAVCAFVATGPLREGFVAWQSQRALNARWQQALGQKHARAVKVSAHPASHKRKHSGASTHKAKHPPLAEVTDSSDDTPEEDAVNKAADTSNSEVIWPLTNCVIAAHRNAFGWWFYRLGELRPDDFVVLQVPGEKFIYRVAFSRVVSVHDTSILEEPLRGAPRLTLYSCTLPKTEKRLVVVANLANSEAT